MNVIERIERGELILSIAEGVEDLPGFVYSEKEEDRAELLRLAKIGAAMQWVPVTLDTMPKHEQDCIICTKDKEVLGGFYYSAECPGFYGKRVGYDVDFVAHYMPLPPLPEPK